MLYFKKMYKDRIKVEERKTPKIIYYDTRFLNVQRETSKCYNSIKFS